MPVVRRRKTEPDAAPGSHGMVITHSRSDSVLRTKQLREGTATSGHSSAETAAC